MSKVSVAIGMYRDQNVVVVTIDGVLFSTDVEGRERAIRIAQRTARALGIAPANDAPSEPEATP